MNISKNKAQLSGNSQPVAGYLVVFKGFYDLVDLRPVILTREVYTYIYTPLGRLNYAALTVATAGSLSQH